MAEFFQNFNWWSILDLISFLLVSVFLIVFFHKRNSIKMAILWALHMLIYFGVGIASYVVGNGFLGMTLKILDYWTIFLIVTFVVVYQSDFKVIISRLAHGRFDNKLEYNLSEESLVQSAGEIVKACQNMAKNDIGALIIIVKNSIPSHLLDTGTALGANVSAGLIESIFSTKGPLHDGAVIIKGDKILSAACFLPLSQEVDIAKDLGTRHRAAIGVTEETDVFSIVVSEETGIISTVKAGQIKRYMTPEKLLEEIKMAYGILSQPTREKKRERKFL